MAGARAGYGAKPGGAAPPPKKVDVKLKFYNAVRWMCYLLFPIAGIVFLVIGLVWAFTVEPSRFVKPLLVIIGGALLTYVSIYYNKR